MKKQKSTSNLTETLIKKPPKLTLLEIEKISNNTFKTNYFPDNQYDNYMNLIMEVLVFNKNCHLVTIFKDFMILDYVDEFLKRYYKNNESKDRIPRFANFYKNYLKFFCKPTFSDFECNEIIQEHSEKKAELYYNQNFRKKDKNNENDDGLFEDESDSNSIQVSKSKIEKTIFNQTIKKQIDETSLETIQVEDNSQGTINLQGNDFIPNQSYLYTKYSSEVSLLNMMNAFNEKKKNVAKNRKNPQPKIHHYLSNSGNSQIKHSKLLSYTSLCQRKSSSGMNNNKNSNFKDSTKEEKNNVHTKSQINFNWRNGIKSRNQNNSMSNQNIHSLTKNDSKYRTYDMFNNNNNIINHKKGISLLKTQNVENILNKLQNNVHRSNIYSIDNLVKGNKNKKNVSSTTNIPFSKKSLNNNISLRRQNNSGSKNKVNSPLSNKNSIISRNSKFPTKKIPISHTVTNYSNNNNNNNDDIMKITLAALLMNKNNNLRQTNHHRINSHNNNKQIQNVNININNQINISNNQFQEILSSKINNKLNHNDKIDINIHNNINHIFDDKTKKFSRNKGRGSDINTNSVSPPFQSINQQNSVYRSSSGVDKKIFTSTMNNFHNNNFNAKSPSRNLGINNKNCTNKLIKSIEKIRINENYYLKNKGYLGNTGYKKLYNKRSSSKN